MGNVHFYSKARNVTPQFNWLWKEPCSEGFNTHVHGFQGDRWENVHFSSKPRHVTQQINCLRKSSPVLSVSSHIYGVSKEIHGKTFMFQVNYVCDPLNWLSWVNKPCSEGFNTHVHGFQGDRWENIHFSRKTRHVTLKSIVLENKALFWGFEHTFMGFPRI